MQNEALTAQVAHLSEVGLRYGKVCALDGVSLDIAAGSMVGLIGPDGVGKSSLLALIAGARRVQRGRVEVLGGDMASARHRARVCARIAYLPQGLGRNLYPTLSVAENLAFFARLFGLDASMRRQRIDALTQATGLGAFLARPVGQLSGGMRQKLGLCCALIHDPALLILDEPTTGVDPLARLQFWQLIAQIRAGNPQMSVVIATAYMDEARHVDQLVAMNAARVLAVGTPAEILARTGSATMEAAFVALLPASIRERHRGFNGVPRPDAGRGEIAIEARGLTKRFGDFVAVDDVSFQIFRGEIFGFLGSNGCGKTTTMKMLTGLMTASAGRAWVFGREVAGQDIATRRRVGYMSQGFSLYGELSVRQNLVLHARLFHVPAASIEARVAEMLSRFGLQAVQDTLPDRLPLGMRQRLSLAVAVVHKPELLILDEPTAGVDPIARDEFWQLMVELSRRDQVTIFISTHVMNEAERCDRISLMHEGRVLESDSPAAIKARRNAPTLEAAFIDYLIEAGGGERALVALAAPAPTHAPPETRGAQRRAGLSRIYSYLWREALELSRDPLRCAMALVGSLLLMAVMGFGLNMDVENLRFAVLDRDNTAASRDYVQSLAAGGHYFSQRAPIADYAELDRRMRSGELSLAIEIPPGFARDLAHGRAVAIGAWIDGAMPARAQTVAGYLAGMHEGWLLRSRDLPAAPKVETRYRYNPDVKSLPAMVPGVITLLLLMLPAMLTALSVVREKELGSIVNFYLTPTTRAEFLLGKQLPYVALAMVNFLLMSAAAVSVFGVPMKGSFFALWVAALLFSLCSTGMGLIASTLTKSQIAAMFFAIVGTMIPAVQFSGLINPVSSLEGAARGFAHIYPASHMFIISRGVFSKALGFADLGAEFLALLAAAPCIFALACLLLPKQER